MRILKKNRKRIYKFQMFELKILKDIKPQCFYLTLGILHRDTKTWKTSFL